MRRSICIAEPKTVKAGASGTWKFAYTTANSLPKGAKLKFDVLSNGRDFEWQAPKSSSKGKGIWLEVGKSKVAAKVIDVPGKLAHQYEFTLPSDVKAEETIIIHMGEDNQSQCHVQRRRPFHLYIDQKGKGEYSTPEIFQIDVKGGELANIRIVAPSLVSKNQRFDVVVRFEDQYGNLTGLAPEGSLIELSYEQLRENLNWKLFVPETGFIALPNLYFNEEGIYRLKLINSADKKTYYSDPIVCQGEGSDLNVYWGLFHGEFVRYDANGEIESLLRHVRDDYAFQFFSTSTCDDEESMPTDSWKKVMLHVSDFNEEERFVSYLGQQWFGDEEAEGLRQFVFLKDNRPLLRQKESRSSHLKKIYRSHSPKDLISIPMFTMGSGAECNFDEFDPEYEPVVDIYNAWGCSECMEKEGNLRPIYSDTRKGAKESKKGSIRAALNRGLKFGFVAGGLDDRGAFAEFYETGQAQYSPGMTAVLSKTQTRDGIITALRARSCYATTGERLVVGMQLAGNGIGSVLSAKEKPGLQFVRYIEGYAIGTSELDRVEFIRNGEVFKTIDATGDYQCKFAFDDTDPLDKLLLTPDKEGAPFIYYYMRAIQKNGSIAWGSPIWVEMPAGDEAPKRGRKKKA